MLLRVSVDLGWFSVLDTIAPLDRSSTESTHTHIYDVENGVTAVQHRLLLYKGTRDARGRERHRGNGGHERGSMEGGSQRLEVSRKPR